MSDVWELIDNAREALTALNDYLEEHPDDNPFAESRLTFGERILGDAEDVLHAIGDEQSDEGEEDEDAET